MAKDVLEVLDGARECLRSGPRGHVSIGNSLEDAKARIAQLIAADVELDAARQAWSESNEGEACDAHFESAEYRRVTVAEMRRAAALAACRGL